MVSITLATSQPAAFFSSFCVSFSSNFAAFGSSSFSPASGPLFAFFPAPAGGVRIVELVVSGISYRQPQLYINRRILVMAELGQSNVGIQKSVQRLRALGQFIQITLKHFGEAVE